MQLRKWVNIKNPNILTMEELFISLKSQLGFQVENWYEIFKNKKGKLIKDI